MSGRRTQFSRASATKTVVASRSLRPEMAASFASPGPQLFYDDDERETTKWSCDVVRKKIMTFLATKEMTQTAFIQAIGSSAPSHSRFMKLKGAWNGTQNQTFWGATRYFVAREAAAKVAKAVMPTAEKKRKRESEVSEKAAKKSALDALLAKVRDPALTAKVEAEGVYDTCDEVRKKSLAFMAETGMTQTAFIKEIGSHPPSWSSFIKMKSKFAGHNPGAGNGAYPGAYYLLEKVRIVKGDKKSAARLKAEAEKAPGAPGYRSFYALKGGYALKNDDGTRYYFAM